MFQWIDQKMWLDISVQERRIGSNLLDKLQLPGSALNIQRWTT